MRVAWVLLLAASCGRGSVALGPAPAVGPLLAFEPSSLAFVDGVPGCVQTETISIQNVGDQPATVLSLSSASPNLAFSGLPDDLTLAPGSSFPVTIEHRPGSEPTDSTFILEATGLNPVVATVTGESGLRSVTDVAEAGPTATEIAYVFVVDQSGSMDAYHAQLDASFSTFASEALYATPNTRVGVVTQRDGCLVAAFDDGDRWLEVATPGRDVSDAIRFGNSNDEDLFNWAERALEQTGPAQCNQGFLLPDALVHFILVSDEDEASSRSVATIAATLQNLSPSNEVVVSSISNLTGCTGPPAVRYDDMALTTTGVSTDLCLTDWSQSLATIARHVRVGGVEVVLSDVPDPPSITVRVDGLEVDPFRITYQPQTNTVFVSDVPSRATLEVTYDLPTC